ncbi:hypothetical protein GE061_009205 [Apolygus lucorum]|uniref:BTB domain-containing protein n=1 Tax=Apolygus lucorum TaxID=248454 RepID=A0A8S9XZH7_APOLU|nr:hypothetical protein GE061_009205 [Apolygus lucorum]
MSHRVSTIGSRRLRFGSSGKRRNNVQAALAARFVKRSFSPNHSESDRHFDFKFHSHLINSQPEMDIKGLEVADLREVSILKNLTDEERSAIKYVHVYGSNRSPFVGPSALYITTKDEVFLFGFDSLVGKSCIEKVPDGQRGFLEKSRKVEELSGKSVRRIVVGEEFGAALTKNNDLYLWGRDLGKSKLLPEEVKRFAVKRHKPGDLCPHCSKVLTEFSGISYCYQNKQFYASATLFPPPSSWQGPTFFALGCKGSSTPALQLPQMYCQRCQLFKNCSFLKTRPIDKESFDFHLLMCDYCQKFIDSVSIPPHNNRVPQKITFTSPISIVDVAAGRNFLLIQTSSELIIWGELKTKKSKSSITTRNYNGILTVQDNVAVAKVACGSNHIAAITTQGYLYIFGDGGANGATMSKVPLKVPAVDVACGSTSTVCLLEDGTCFIRGEIVRMVPGLTFSMNVFHSTCRCVPAVMFQNYQKVMESSLIQLNQSEIKRSAELTGDPTDVFIHLYGASMTSSDGKPIKKAFCVREELEPTTVETTVDQNSRNAEYLKNGTKLELLEKNTEEKKSSGFPAHQISNFDLFGQQHLSDLTLKLADGNMPVHRSVLHSSSSYFKQLFSESTSLAVLDMSSYNPSAYRVFLQYLYRVPVSEIKCEDLVDVYVLATSYKEDWVASNVFSKLKSSISSDNVLLLLDKAKAIKSTELEQECHKFISAPEFKKSLFESVSENMDVLTDFLRSLSTSRS